MAQPVIYQSRPLVVLIAAWAAIVLLLVTAVAGLCAWRNRDPKLLYILGALWAVGPPVWFWYEYFYVFRSTGDSGGFEQFKYGQQVAIAIWAGVALAVFAFVSSDHFKTEKNSLVTLGSGCPAAENQSSR